MKEKLHIIGAGSVGGHIALNINQYTDVFEIQGFFDDDPQKIGTVQFGYEVKGPINKALELQDEAIVIGIAFPKTKQKILSHLSSNASLRYPSLIHEKAWISNDVTIGQGCIIYPGTTINFASAIQDFVVLNANCSLGHHTSVGSYSSFAPGVCTGGHTTIAEAVDVGIGVSTLQDVTIGTESIIGGQSMIIQDVKTKSTVAGIPAKNIS